MNTANLCGATIAYEVAGAGEPVLFIHGALIADSFKPLMGDPSLVRDYRLINYYRRGYSRSGRVSAPPSISQQADDGLDLLAFLGVERAHVVGHSYGGVIAIQLSLAAPEVVHTLSLLEPALMVGDSGGEYRESLLRGVARFQEVGPEVVVDEFLSVRFGKGYRGPLERTLPGAFESALVDAATSISELPALIEWRFGEQEAARVSQPVLCVLGEESRELSPRFAETYSTLLEWFPDVEGFELTGAAHGLQMQNPDGMATGLRRFWERHAMKPT